MRELRKMYLITFMKNHGRLREKITHVAKAKALRKYVEPILTKSKSDTTHSRRSVFSHLQNKESVNELFTNISEKISSRPGGYTRIIKIGNRLGDNAEMCIIELVDYNTFLVEESAPQKKTSRRRRKKKTSEPTQKDSSAKKNDDKKKESKKPKKDDKKDSK